MNRYKILNCLQNDQNVINQLYVYAMNMKKIVCCISTGLLQDVSQSSRKRRIRRIFTPIFAFVRVKFPSEDSHLRSIATGRPN